MKRLAYERLLEWKSLLDVGLHEGKGFPVGKVDEINLYPLSFKEFFDGTW